MRPTVAVLLCLLVLAGYLWLIPAPGTSDVTDYWMQWTALMRDHGVVAGYGEAHSDYTPGAFVLLDGIGRVARARHIDNVLLLKISLALFALLSGVIFGVWTRSVLFGGLLSAALLLSSAALGYLDVLYLPPLLLSIVAIRRGEIGLSALAFAVAMAIKWQPLIIAPFLGLYVVKISGWPGPIKNRLSVRDAVSGVIVLVIAASGLWIFGWHSIESSFSKATNYRVLSLQGLNANWLLQLAYYAYRGVPPVQPFIVQAPRAVTTLIRVAFAGTYLLVLIRFWTHGRTFADFIWSAFAGALAYFSLSTGVHENHLFIAMILASCLLVADVPSTYWVVAYTMVAANLNLVLFYGLDGQIAFRSSFNAVTAIVALANTLFFLRVITAGLMPSAQSGERDLAGTDG